jgi:chromosome segregation ATPase
MDAVQTARMIEWLDEERRRDKNTIARLEERSNQQQELIDQLKRQINGLQDELATVRAQAMPADRDQEIIDRLRYEFDQVVEALEAKRLTAEREMERRYDIMRETLLAPVRQLEDQQNRTTEAIRDVLSVRGDRDRMSAAIAAMQQRVEDLAKKIEDPERRITLLEEQRRQDSRRLSEVQSTLPDMTRTLEQLSTRLDLLEGLVKATEKRIIEVQNAEAQRREEIQQFLDQQNLITQQRDQQISELRNRVVAYDDDMRRNLERFESWAETHRQMRKIVEDFERIGERLERRINEVAEMQRLSEDRFRAEWNDWISDDQLRWKEFTVSNDESWRAHEREMQDLRTRLKDLLAVIEPLERSIDRVWRLQRAQAELYRDRYQALLLEYDKPDKPPTNGGS